MTARSRRGVTLVELLVALTVLAVSLSVVGLAARPVRTPAAEDATSRVAAARRTALRDGAAVTITLTVDGQSYAVTALPDGGVVADEALGVDRFDGRRAARAAQAGAADASR